MVEILLSSLETAGADGHMVAARREKLDPVNATMVNGAMAHVLDFDDTILPTRCHISAPMLSSLLAASELTRTNGHELLAAFVVGFELVTRCADAVYDGNTGWHGTGIMGPIGVSAAVGRLLGFDVATTAQGFAIAANQSAGLRSSFGSMSKSLNLGKAGANGLLAALLARRGFTGGTGTLDHHGGFLELFAESPALHILTEELGTRWAVDRNGFKPYPCGFVAHAAIDGTLEARRSGEIPPESVRAIRLTLPPETLRLTANRSPRTGLEAKFSVFHAVAKAFLDGHVSPASFTDAAVTDSRTRSLWEKVEVQVEPAFHQGEARVEVLGDHQVVDVHIPHALGSESNPMTDDQLNEKFQRLVEPILGHRGEPILEVLWTIENREVKELLDLISFQA